MFHFIPYHTLQIFCENDEDFADFNMKKSIKIKKRTLELGLGVRILVWNDH